MNWEEAAGYSIVLDEVDGKVVWRSVLDRGVDLERNEMTPYEREHMLKELYLKGTYKGKKLRKDEDDGVGGSKRNMKRSGVGSEMDSAEKMVSSERCKQKQQIQRDEGVSASREIVNALPSLRTKWNRGPVKKKTTVRKRKRDGSVNGSKPDAAGENYSQQDLVEKNGAASVSKSRMTQPMPVESVVNGFNASSSVSPIANMWWYLLLKELAKSKDDGGRSSEALERLMMNEVGQSVPKEGEKLGGEQKVVSSGEEVSEAAPAPAPVDAS